MKLVAEEELNSLITQNEELKKYGEKLTQSNLKLQRELEETQNKLKHLEEIVKFNKSPVAVGSNEEELCKLEIRRLYESAKQGPLAFNEVKAFEIYVKSLMLIQGKSSAEDKKSRKSESASLNHEQLLQLALQVVDDTSEQ
jgi:5-bromo-4-chloroindolyl phosphate hydrolysis protein